MASCELHGAGGLLSSVSCSILVPHRSRSYYQWPHGLCFAPSYPLTDCHSPTRCGSLTTFCLFSPISSRIQVHPDIKIMLLHVNDLPIANSYGTSQLICYFLLLDAPMPLSLADIAPADCFPGCCPSPEGQAGSPPPPLQNISCLRGSLLDHIASENQHSHRYSSHLCRPCVTQPRSSGPFWTVSSDCL